MNENQINSIKRAYPPGTRVQLDHMSDDPHPIQSGTKGTVDFTDDAGTVFVTFDNGRQLGICPEVDRFHKITEHRESIEYDNSPQISM